MCSVVDTLNQWSSIPLMQLGSGLIGLEQWGHINAHLADNVSIDSGKEVSVNVYQGSHLCHNGESDGGVYCRNILSMKWESSKDNQARKLCHNKFIQDPDDGDCICAPGLTLPCKNRAKETRETVRKASMDRLKAIQRECTNRIGRCPYCKYEFAIISRLSDYSSVSTLRALARHLNIMHGAKLGLP
jgi:hypothetical protein